MLNAFNNKNKRKKSHVNCIRWNWRVAFRLPENSIGLIYIYNSYLNATLWTNTNKMLLKKKRYMCEEQDDAIDIVAVVEASNNRNTNANNNSSSSYGSNMAETREVRIEEQLKVKIGM